jgi:N-acetylglucosaminyldiphosphoundecaprenol N-acetyl-beta-D-mannosaminyltransferase
MNNTVNFLSYKIPSTSVECLSSHLFYSILNEKEIALHFSASHGFVEAEKNKSLKVVFNSEIVVSDGFPLSRYLKIKDKDFVQIRGTDFMRITLRKSPKEISHFFLGSSEENLSALIFNIQKINPSINIVGHYSPKFGLEWQTEIHNWEKLILNSKANVVWVGMGAPKQFLISSSLKNTLKISTVSVGAAFDFLAETKPEAPIFFQKIGFEWCYRLLREPRRLFIRYLIGNFHFLRLLRIDAIRIFKSKLTNS